MQRQEQYYWLRLMWTNGLSFEMAKNLLTTIGLPELIFSSSYATLCRVVPDDIARRLCMRVDSEIDERIQKTIAWIESTPSADLIALTDSRYPTSLLAVPQPPLAFFVLGDSSYLSQPSVSLLGSSNPNQEGIELAREWAMTLSQSVVVVEAMSEGVERAALQGVWKASQARAILVSDEPLGESRASVIEAMSQRHLVVSLIGPFDKVGAEQRWELRNRLLVGLCSSFVLVQASIRSRALNFLREALDLNRNVMAIPGSVHSPLSKGPHYMIKYGARLVETTNEVFEEMRVK